MALKMTNPNIYNSRLDAFELYHKQQQSKHSILEGPALPALGHALAGSTGAAISNLAIYPLDLVITRLQVQRQLRSISTSPEEGEYKGVLDAFKKIWSSQGGLKAFYVGIVEDTGKSIADSFLFFLFYNYLRANRLQKKTPKATTLPALDELLVGALAGACAKFFTTPISNIVTRKQTASMISARTKSPSVQSSVANIVSKIHSEKGLQGFWSGYSASLVLTLNPSITFFLYETFKRILLPRSKRDDPGAKLTFLMAAISKAIASTTTYPFSLAKKRAQASTSSPIDPASTTGVNPDVAHASDVSGARNSGQNASGLAKQATVFNTILQIYRDDGVEALYEGVWGEVLKGFFSHGITMIVKETAHKLIIQLYYWVLKALNKYPSPTELAEQAKQAVEDRTEHTVQEAKVNYDYMTSTVGDALESGKQAVGNVVKSGKNAVMSVLENASDKVAEISAVDKIASDNANFVSPPGPAGRLGVVSNITESPDKFKSQVAGNLLGNAQEMLGDKVKEVTDYSEAKGWKS